MAFKDIPFWFLGVLVFAGYFTVWLAGRAKAQAALVVATPRRLKRG